MRDVLEALYEAVWQSPDDDGPRRVLADALIERHDPRGEFIALQLAPDAAAHARRCDELLSAHWRRWLKEVPSVQRTGLTFTRGFVQRAVIQPVGRGLDSRQWSTVEVLKVLHAREPAELTAVHLSRVRELQNLDAAAMEVVLTGPLRTHLQRLEFLGPWLTPERAPREQALVTQLDRFTSLHELSLHPTPFVFRAEHQQWLFESPLMRQLRRLRLTMSPQFDVRGYADLINAMAPAGFTLELAHPGLVLTLTTRSFTLTFEDESALTRLAPTVRNQLGQWVPHVYSACAIVVGGKPAHHEHKRLLGEAAQRHA